MKMKSSLKIIIPIIALLILIMILFPNSYYVVKGYILYGGFKKCNCDELAYATVITDYKCHICGRKSSSGSTWGTELCDSCSKITNRCANCGAKK